MRANLALVHDTSAPPLTPNNISDQGGEPRVRDVDLAERLGFDNPLMIRKLIERNAGELRTYGAISATVSENKDPKGRGRPGKVSWLNEGQCLLLCALSRTPRAAAVRKQVIDVFIAYRAGHLVPAAPVAPSIESVAAQPVAWKALSRSGRTGADGLKDDIVVLAEAAAELYDGVAALRAEFDRLAQARALPPPTPAQATPPMVSTEGGALILGARAIGAYLGLSERQVKHAVSIGALPVFRIGRLIRTSKPALDAWIAESARAGRVAR